MYKKIYVPVDNSEYSNSCIDFSIELAEKFNSQLVGSHVYAAKMHESRFKQMQNALPQKYQEGRQLEKQRKTHDSLISMGLQLISDSYLDAMRKKCRQANLPFEAKTFDGKNYQALVEDIQKSDYDLVIIGALGMGAVKSGIIGSVCERVVRRIKVDTLVVKNTHPLSAPKSGKNGGKIVVGIDGSPEAFSALKSAIAISKAFDKQIETVTVYDPHFHYLTFQRIAEILSEQAARIFRFKEQEELHEEVIKTGLAKIYQAHLEAASKIAKEEGVDLNTTLLDGKVFEKILQFVREEKAWLLVLGRIGVHSSKESKESKESEEMDIGSNSENLLRLAPCNLLLCSRKYPTN